MKKPFPKMLAAIPTLCRCGGIAEPVFNSFVHGYPAIRCPKCGERWFVVICGTNAAHRIDSRVARRCNNCNRFHCPVCNQCNQPVSRQLQSVAVK